MKSFYDIRVVWALLCVLVFLNCKAQLTWSFTPCGASGRFGPTQAMVNSAYASTNLSGSVTINLQGIQEWTVPYTGTYRMEARGASSGISYFVSGTWYSFGAYAAGDFNFTAGTVLKILVGQNGISNSSAGAGSGGGGSFIVMGTTPLLVAGGSAGFGGNCASCQGTNSVNSFSNSIGAIGGTGGGGGAASATSWLFAIGGTSTTPGSNANFTIGAGGGGGFFTNGGNYNNNTASGGQAFLNGGLGGDSAPTCSCPGGFGGGGGAGNRSGGGGGFSGGGSNSSTGGSASGTGGGSFNAGTNQTMISTVTSTIIPFPFANEPGVVISFTCDINATGPSSTICNSSNATLSCNGTSNYSWTSTNGFIGSTQSVVVSPSVNTTYSVSATTSIGCPASTIITVSVTPLISPAIAASSPSACAGQSFVLSGSASGGAGGFSYSWLNGPTSPNYTTSTAIAGPANYTLGVTDANNCSATLTTSVNIIANPVISATSVSFCPNSSVSISASGAISYTWLPVQNTGSTIVVTPISNFVYTVIGAAAGCTTVATANTSLYALPSASFATFSITCANLGSATISAFGTGGPYTYSWLPVSQFGSVANNLSPGTYTISIFDSASGCISNTTTVFTSLIPLSGILVNGSVSCYGGSNASTSFTNINGGSMNQNYLWTNTTQTLSSPNPNNLTAGNWSVSVTDALTACQINSVFVVQQPSALILTLSASAVTACANTSVNLNGLSGGGTPGYTYTWTNAAPSSSVVVSEPLAGTYVYSLSVLDANQCLSSNTIALNFIANPILTVSDVSICPLKFGTLTASGATSYTWTLSSSPPSTTLGVTVVDNPLVDTQYTVVGSALGCTSIATASIILHPVPVPLIQSNSPRCEGTSLDVNASGGNIYQWSGPSSFNSNLPFNTISNLGLNHGGTYNLTVTSVNGCTASTSANLVVNPIPAVSAAGSTVCTSQTLSLFANSIPGVNYNWTGPATFVSAIQNPTLANPGLNRTGTYSVIATSVLGCTNIATAQVSVISPPNLSVALSSNSLCAQAFNGSPNTITLTGIGANTYTLYTPNILGSLTPPIPSTSVFATPPFSSSIAIGTATLQGSNGVCASTASFVFTVVPNPTVGVSSFTPVICAGQNYTYTSNGASSYVWTATTPNYTTYSNGGVAVTHPSVNSVFSVYGSSLGCNSALQTSSITVNPIPTLTLSAASNSICLNENTKLSAAGAGTSFTWSPANGLSNTTTSAVVASPQVSQNYTVLVSVANCTNVANLFLTVLPLPKPKIDFATPAVCLNGQISFKGSGGVSYDWRGPDQLFLQGQNPVFEALSSSYAGNYTLTVTDFNGCKSSTVTTVEILPAPSGYLNNFKEEACAPYCTTFNFLFSDKNKAVKSSWMINDQFLSGNMFSYCFSSAGVYTINGSIVDETTNCKNTTSYLLNVHPKPKADFIFSPKQPIEGQDEVIFTNNSSGDGNLSFNWYFNDNKGYSTSQKNTSYLYYEPGEYRVVLVSKNNWKCADTILKIIKVESDFALYVPNAFTPNGDERNDIFLPVVRSVKKYDLKIFDRWGKMLFQTTDPNQGWDGTFNGVLCKQEVYVWKIYVVSVDGIEKFETGNVTSLPEE